MKGIYLTTLLAVFAAELCKAQADTTIVYYDKGNKETYKDSAYSYVKSVRQGDVWYGKAYLIKSNVLKFEGTYADKNMSIPVGTSKNYNSDGILDYITQYANGKIAEQTRYYKSGNKRSWISYSDKGPSQQKGWDEEGREIKDYVVERAARFKGGLEGWRRFLEKTLNASVAAESGAPEGMYPVKVQFIVSKEGYVSNVKAIEIPADCKACAKEAVAVLTASPAWEPAIQNNVPVIYQAIQHITFQVAEGRKRGKRS